MTKPKMANRRAAAMSEAATTNTGLPQEGTVPLSPHQQRWNKCWYDFNRALRSPRPFNGLEWIYRLSCAGLDYLYCQSRLNVLVEKYKLAKIWIPMIPLLVMGLLLFLFLLYALSLRGMVRERWCPTATMASSSSCPSVIFHDFLVTYFVGMILYNYLKTNLSSPGVALSSNKRDVGNDDSWTCMDNQGGFFGSGGYPKLNEEAERHRLSLYGELESSCTTTVTDEKKGDHSSAKPQQSPSKKIFPSPNATCCDKCCITRPPRCHHCRVCNRCILQFDHHCVWVNNCIGYNNYRSFLALLLHIVIACWYSLSAMVVPFYELIRKEQTRQASEYDNDSTGWLKKVILTYQRSQFFDEVPTNPWAMSRAFVIGLPWPVAIKIAYPLLLGIGVVMSVFLGFHVKYVIKARTTLEHRVILENLVDSLLTATTAVSLWKQTRLSVADAENSIHNPFDEGWRSNISRILGPNIWHILLPVHVEPLPPFLPKPNMDYSDKKGK